MGKGAFTKLDRREKGLAVVFLAALLTGLWLPTRLIVSTSDSLNHRVFFRIRYDMARIRVGDYLVFKQEQTPFVQARSQGDALFIKRVGCTTGDTLRRDDKGHFFCGHTFLGQALAQDSKGRDLPQFLFNGPVPADAFFMLGSHSRSFDSKYFGFIHADEIIHKALPLW